METHCLKKTDKIKNKIRNRRGMSMAEVLIVIAIIGVLMGVAFISVQAYQRSMALLERDSIAKEIFVAAQNHLTMAMGEGYPGVSGEGAFGKQLDSEKTDDIYYYVVNGSIPEGTALAQMLPFGSVDETVRIGGSYIIRYQKNSGLVLDVFYSSKNGNPSQFNHTMAESDYAQLMANEMADYKKYTGSGNKERQHCKINGDFVLGWYGGNAAADLPSVELEAPTIKVVNAERLYVNVSDPNAGKTDNQERLITYGTDYFIRLIITGNSSKKSHYLDLDVSELSGNAGSKDIELDNITADGKHFAEVRFNDMDTMEASNGFYPGENVTIQAVAYCRNMLANVAYSAKKTTNSLFADGTDLTRARISNFRHLENLDTAISAVFGKRIDNSSEVRISEAVQTSNLDWTAADGGYWNAAVIRKSDIRIADLLLSATPEPGTAGNYMPVCPEYELSYDGGNHSISNVKTIITASETNKAGTGDAGLFGTASEIKKIKDLELIDFKVSGVGSAGALAGDLSGTDVVNVIARNSKSKDKADTPTVISTEGPAGGLIGTISGGSVQYSAAALVTEGSLYAGGLIGNIADSANPALITSSYSGGHTKNAAYDTITGTDGKIIYNVTATAGSGIAGGLIGNAGKADISYSYSTCSVSGTTAGGFIGKADTGTTGAHVSNSYCTGLVSDDSKDNAFIGDGSAAVSTVSAELSYFYEIVNEVELKDENDKVTGIKYKEAVPGLAEGEASPVKAIDESADSYETFVGAERKKASAYDADLVSYYNGEYSLKTIEQLEGSPFSGDHAKYFVKVHYGDWPAPEIFVINET